MCICRNHQKDIIIKVNSLPPGKEYRTSGFPSLGQRRWKVWRLFVREEIMRQFLKYTTLSILGTMGISCYILADTFFIAQGLGTEGLAALNLAIPVYNFIYGTALMLGMGGAIKFAILKSQGNQNQINTVYTNTIYLAVIFSAVFMLLGIFGSGTLARLLGAEGVVFEMTKTYLKWLLIFSPAFIINDIFLRFLRNDEAPQLSMIAMLIGSFSNIILDYIFIFPMGMGILGAVLATGASPVIGIILMSKHWRAKKNSFHLVKEKINLGIVKQNLSLGFPSLIGQVAAGITMIVFNFLILELEGNTGVAAYGVIANISIVIIGVFNGIAEGVQPLVADSYGSGNRKEIKSLHKYSMVMMAMIAIVIYVIIYIFADPITSIFNSEQNEKMQELAVIGLKLYFTSMLVAGYNIVITVFFTSTERVLPAQVLTLLRGIVLIVPLSFLMAKIWGMNGIWMTFPATELIVAVIGWMLYRKKH